MVVLVVLWISFCNGASRVVVLGGWWRWSCCGSHFVVVLVVPWLSLRGGASRAVILVV